MQDSELLEEEKKLLKFFEPLAIYQIVDDQVVHLVARAANSAAENQQQQQ